MPPARLRGQPAVRPPSDVVQHVVIPRIKICCIASRDEAQVAFEAGASAIGLVSAMPSGPGPIPECLIVEIAESAPPGIDTFLLTCLQDPDDIIAQHRRCRTTTIQLCDAVPPSDHSRIRKALPKIRIVQVIHVTGPESIEVALAADEHADALLLDSGNPGLSVKELGGTGRVHDWETSRRIVESVRVPVYLAGGLRGENVASAIRTVRPYGVDVCSGVRTEGRLDPEKLSAFTSAVARAAD